MSEEPTNSCSGSLLGGERSHYCSNSHFGGGKRLSLLTCSYSNSTILGRLKISLFAWNSPVFWEVKDTSTLFILFCSKITILGRWKIPFFAETTRFLGGKSCWNSTHFWKVKGPFPCSTYPFLVITVKHQAKSRKPHCSVTKAQFASVVCHVCPLLGIHCLGFCSKWFYTWGYFIKDHANGGLFIPCRPRMPAKNSPCLSHAFETAQNSESNTVPLRRNDRRKKNASPRKTCERADFPILSIVGW